MKISKLEVSLVVVILAIAMIYVFKSPSYAEECLEAGGSLLKNGECSVVLKSECDEMGGQVIDKKTCVNEDGDLLILKGRIDIRDYENK